MIGSAELTRSSAIKQRIPALAPAVIWSAFGYVLLAALRHRFTADEYSSSAALVVCAVILSVPGSLLQVTAAPSLKWSSDRDDLLGTSTPISRTLAAVLAA